MMTPYIFDPLDEDNPRIPYLCPGKVTDNADPEALGRVKILIPGIVEPETDWAFPASTFAGGGPQRGAHAVPDIGADVNVMFLLGDPEQPRWFAGHWGVREDTGSEMPEDATAAAGNAHRLAYAQFGSFRFVVDERDSVLQFRIEGRDGDDIGVSAELDLKRKQIALNATVGIVLKTLGLIHLDGMVVRLQDRLLAPKSGAV